ncbi:MAG: holo-ACP synthase [Solobacterium sp.]|nr:holo-ACP synthase [Solobacterium sp.]
MVGIDIVDLSRIVLRESFVKQVLTDMEQKEYYARTSEKRRIEYIGGRFAAKEAIFKATQDRRYLRYSILNGENGAPYVLDHPEIAVSITHDGGFAAAVVQISK